MEILKILFLFCSIWLTVDIIARLIIGDDVYAIQVICQSISITGFIYVQWVV